MTKKEYWIVGYFPNLEKWGIILKTSNKQFAEQELKELKRNKTNVYYPSIKQKLIKLE